jgi:lipopolysaccharide/colanic/teichoic acid biosynthesis glycosyltransferase
MKDNLNNAELLPDELRTTAIGKILRQFSIDELPQLWNVVIGDMSLIGPRPLLVDYLSHYSTEQKKRHDVLPGITGWAQINGRDEISIEKKVALEKEYLERKSLIFDIYIIFKTFTNVLFSKGVAH